MKFTYIETEVSGGLGSQTEIDNTVHPPKIESLHYELEGWLGNDILESFPCYIITERLKRKFEQSHLTGYSFDNVLITTSNNFKELYPNIDLPSFFWLKISGEAGIDDFGISTDYRLVISDKVLTILGLFNINAADIEEFR